MKIIFFVLFFIVSICKAENRQHFYDLFIDSECYNTSYFFHNSIIVNNQDTIVWIDKKLPSTFVIETNSLKDNQHKTLIYNENERFVIRKEKGRYIVNGKVLKKVVKNDRKISLYCIDGQVHFYIDEKLFLKGRLKIDYHKQIGLQMQKNKGYSFLNCYEPIPFQFYDYCGSKNDLVNTETVRMAPHNVGKDYSLTFPVANGFDEKRVFRFEYRYEDSQDDSKDVMRRARSEISGVFCYSPLNKWIIEYDLMVPEETGDDDLDMEIITQIHEHSSIGITPAFCLLVKNGILSCALRGDSIPIERWKNKNVPSYHDDGQLIYLERKKWYHVKIFLKEGSRYDELPLTKVWVNSQLLFESNTPNCYIYKPLKPNVYDYLKFGIYKPGWKYRTECDSLKMRRIYLFRNFTVKC